MCSICIGYPDSGVQRGKSGPAKTHGLAEPARQDLRRSKNFRQKPQTAKSLCLSSAAEIRFAENRGLVQPVVAMKSFENKLRHADEKPGG